MTTPRQVCLLAPRAARMSRFRGTVQRDLPMGPGALLSTRRYAGVDLLSSLSKLGQSRDLAEDLKAGRQRNNKAIIESFQTMQTIDAIHYRKTARPWELVPRYAKKRVTDLVGILSTEDRMEIEQAIDSMQSLCQTDLYVVIVPTVGYTTPKAFANSIFFDWAIGEPQGNGLLLVIAQHEASVQLIASPAIEEYFDMQFLQPAVTEIFQPQVRDGKPSYATVQLVYAIARQAQEMRPHWESGLLALPTRNKVRLVGKTVRFGIYKVPYLLAGAVIFTALTAWLVSQMLDTLCPTCHRLMDRIRDDATMQSIMTRGQYLEWKNGCAYYRVWRCPHCLAHPPAATPSGEQKPEGEEPAITRVIVCSRDLHQSSKCLQCIDCDYYTCAMEKEIVKLPSKTEDGLKRMSYHCENCNLDKEVLLPLFRPVDKQADEPWYGFLMEGSQSHKQTGNKQ